MQFPIETTVLIGLFSVTFVGHTKFCIKKSPAHASMTVMRNRENMHCIGHVPGIFNSEIILLQTVCSLFGSICS